MQRFVSVLDTEKIFVARQMSYGGFNHGRMNFLLFLNK